MSRIDPIGVHSSQYNNDYTEAENQQFTAAFSEITESFKQAMAQKLPPNSDEVQALVLKHYEFVSKFWKPTKEAYKSLAMSYILPSPYKDTYEAVAVGLGKYHYDAIVIWAEQNL